MDSSYDERNPRNDQGYYQRLTHRIKKGVSVCRENWEEMDCFSFFIILSSTCFQIVQAQEFPTKPVTLVIPLTAGGTHDLTARAIARKAVDYLGQPIIILNKPGGGGGIGSGIVFKAPPDGYTLAMGGPGWSTILPALKAGPRVRMI